MVVLQLVEGKSLTLRFTCVVYPVSTVINVHIVEEILTCVNRLRSTHGLKRLPSTCLEQLRQKLLFRVASTAGGGLLVEPDHGATRGLCATQGSLSFTISRLYIRPSTGWISGIRSDFLPGILYWIGYLGGCTTKNIS